MIAIGIGARSGVTADEIGEAIMKAEAAAGERAYVIATFAEAAFHEKACAAAARAGTPFKSLTLPELRQRSGDCKTPSERSLAAHGVTSISEAAALVAAGPNSRLIVPRVVSGAVTVAAARSKDDEEVAP